MSKFTYRTNEDGDVFVKTAGMDNYKRIRGYKKYAGNAINRPGSVGCAEYYDFEMGGTKLITPAEAMQLAPIPAEWWEGDDATA